MSLSLQKGLSHKTNQSRLIPTLLALAIGSISIPAHAQEAWQIDPKYSVATLELGSGVKTLQIGLARVSGEVIFESSDPTDPVVRFNMSGQTSNAEYASMSFISGRSTITGDGKIAVTGDLSVTRIERSVTADPTEAYSGPQYGPPVAYTNTRQVTLVFSDPRQLASQKGVMDFSGNGSVTREDFPQLLDAITMDDWPSQLVNDEKCTNPSTGGEDYHGPVCTGTVIASVSNAVIPTGAPSGEGFYGFVPVVRPDRNKAAIALDLRLKKISAGADPKLR